MPTQAVCTLLRICKQVPQSLRVFPKLLLAKGGGRLLAKGGGRLLWFGKGSGWSLVETVLSLSARQRKVHHCECWGGPQGQDTGCVPGGLE